MIVNINIKDFLEQARRESFVFLVFSLVFGFERSAVYLKRKKSTLCLFFVNSFRLVQVKIKD